MRYVGSPMSMALRGGGAPMQMQRPMGQPQGMGAAMGGMLGGRPPAPGPQNMFQGAAGGMASPPQGMALGMMSQALRGGGFGGQPQQPMGGMMGGAQLPQGRPFGGKGAPAPGNYQPAAFR